MSTDQVQSALKNVDGEELMHHQADSMRHEFQPNDDAREKGWGLLQEDYCKSGLMQALKE